MIHAEENVEYKLIQDADGNALIGEKSYVFRLPPNIPAKEYWSVIVYDIQTRQIIKNGQSWPSVYSSRKGLFVNQDGSVDVWFGAKAPLGKEDNWIKTIPGSDWNMVMRLYGTLESWHNQTWRPGEIVAINNNP